MDKAPHMQQAVAIVDYLSSHGLDPADIELVAHHMLKHLTILDEMALKSSDDRSIPQLRLMGKN